MSDFTTDAADSPRRLIAVAVLLLVLLTVAIPVWLWWNGSSSSASFADSEVLETNRLGAGTIDIEVSPTSAAFTALNLAPGDMVSGHLLLTNSGSLPLRYWVTATSSGGLLSQWLLFGVWVGRGQCAPTDTAPRIVDNLQIGANVAQLVGQPARDEAAPAPTLAPGESELICLGATLPLVAPNSVQSQQMDVEIVVNAEHDIEAAS